MGIAAILGGVAAVGSIGSAASSIFGGSGAGSSLQTGQTFTPPNQGAEAQNYENIVAQLYGAGASESQTLMPQYQQQAGQLTNSPYAGLAQQGANYAADVTPGVAGIQSGGASYLANQGGAFAPYISQALQTGFDPQQALYGQQRQQTLDQANAVNAQSGLGGTPYGASTADNALNNFNINWQNQQLGRQQTASQTASGLNQAAGLDFNAASTLGTGALSTLVSGYGSPYATSTGQATNALTGLNSLTNAYTGTEGLPQQTLQDLQSYLDLGQSASAQNLNSQNTGFNQSQTLGSNLATSLSNPALSNLFSSSSPYYNTGGYAGADAGGYGYSGGGSYAAY